MQNKSQFEQFKNVHKHIKAQACASGPELAEGHESNQRPKTKSFFSFLLFLTSLLQNCEAKITIFLLCCIQMKLS